jgi:predicted transcriptional regulator
MRRSRIDIVVDVLEVTKNGVNKTAIVYKTNLNFTIAEKYLLLLEKQGLLEKKSDKYFTSNKGNIFLGKAKDLTMQLEIIIQNGKENTKLNETPMLKHTEMTLCEPPIQIVG